MDQDFGFHTLKLLICVVERVIPSNIKLFFIINARQPTKKSSIILYLDKGLLSDHVMCFKTNVIAFDISFIMSSWSV